AVDVAPTLAAEPQVAADVLAGPGGELGQAPQRHAHPAGAVEEADAHGRRLARGGVGDANVNGEHDKDLTTETQRHREDRNYLHSLCLCVSVVQFRITNTSHRRGRGWP